MLEYRQLKSKEHSKHSEKEKIMTTIEILMREFGFTEEEAKNYVVQWG